MSSIKILGRWDSVAISIGIVIGVGIFRVPSEVAGFLNSGIWILIAWFLGGVFSFIGALCYAELSSIYPSSGGDYVYLKECYGKCLAFIFAWSELLITRTGSVAAIGLMFGEYSCSLVNAPDLWIKPLAVAIVIALTITNLFGLKTGSLLQNIFTLAKLLALVLIFVAGSAALLEGRASATDFSLGTLSEFNASVGIYPLVMALMTALVPILWTYGGWRDNVFLAGETRDAHKSVPFALIITCLTVTLIYMGMNFLYLYHMPIDAVASSRLIATDLFKVIFGTGGAKFLEALVVLFGFGAINALILTGSRIAHAMADDNLFFEFLSKVDPKTHTPIRATIFNGAWACLLIYLIGKFENLLFFTGLAVWIFFALTAICVIIVRQRKDEKHKDSFKTPLYPVIPLVVALVSILLAVSAYQKFPHESFWGTVIVLFGIPVYFLQKMKNRSSD